MNRLFAALAAGCLLFSSGLCPAPAAAQAEAAGVAAPVAPGFRSTDLPLPRFASLKSDKIYVRAGPAMRYPIRWIYTRAGLPVEIIQEFEAWRRVRDFEGDEGWVHQSLLSGTRTAIVSAEDLIPAHDKPAGDARLSARLEPRVMVRLDRCAAAWCRVEAHGYKGWVEKRFLWGVYPREAFD